MDKGELIRELAEEVLHDLFPQAHFAEIRVREETDDDGEETYTIDVMIDPRRGGFDVTRLRDVPRELMARLQAEEVTGLPVLSFISKTDWKKKGTEAR